VASTPYHFDYFIIGGHAHLAVPPPPLFILLLLPDFSPLIMVLPLRHSLLYSRNSWHYPTLLIRSNHTTGPTPSEEKKYFRSWGDAFGGVKEEAAAAEEAAKKNKSFFLFLLLIYAFIRCPSLQRPLSAFVYKCISGVGNTKKISHLVLEIYLNKK